MSLWRLDYERLGLPDSLLPRLVFPILFTGSEKASCHVGNKLPMGASHMASEQQLMGN